MNFLEYFIKYTLVRSLYRFLKPKYLILILSLGIILFFVINNYGEASTPLKFETWNNLSFIDSGTDVQVASFSGLHGYAVYIQPNTWGSLYIDFTSSEFHYAMYVGNAVPTIGDKVFNYHHTDTNGYLSFDATIGTYRDTGYWLVYYSVDATSSTYPSYDFVYDESEAGRIDSTIQEQTDSIISSQQQTTNSINNLNDSITSQNDYMQSNPDSSNFDSSDLPSNSSVGSDITVEGFNNIFTTFYNSMTRGPSSNDNITVVIPFTGKSFVIPYNYTSTYCPSYLKNLINLFWYFVISLYIVKDVANKFNKLRTGNVEDLQNSNIKGDLL